MKIDRIFIKHLILWKIRFVKNFHTHPPRPQLWIMDYDPSWPINYYHLHLHTHPNSSLSIAFYLVCVFLTSCGFYYFSPQLPHSMFHTDKWWGKTNTNNPNWLTIFFGVQKIIIAASFQENDIGKFCQLYYHCTSGYFILTAYVPLAHSIDWGCLGI